MFFINEVYKGILLLIILISTLFAHNSHSSDKFYRKYYNTIQSIIWAADKVEIPREMLLSLCWGESSFRTKKVTHIDGGSLSYGICQIKLSTAQFMDTVYKHKIKATPERLEDPMVNAFYAAKFLKLKLKKYNGNYLLAVDAYNKNLAISDHTEYVKKFNKHYNLIKNELKEIL